MILGSKCTRNCSFCNIESSYPDPVNANEPEMVARAAKELGLRYVVVTSVTRDDLSDGGAGHFADTVLAIRRNIPNAKVEVLTPDFQGNCKSLATVLNSRPDVYNHNIETVPRLYPAVRHSADYKRSLNLLQYTKKYFPDITIKSGLMLGLGEKLEEVVAVLRDLRNAGCDIITMGQYLRPSRKNLPVAEYIFPETFEWLRTKALSLGFRYAASAPLVRSSMSAEEMYNN